MKGKTLNTTVKPENESKHTPGEWDITQDEGTISKYRIYETTIGKNIGWFDPDEETTDDEIGNVNRIITAVNCHDDFVSFMKELLHVYTDPTFGDLVWRLAVVEQCEKLLAKATNNQ